MMMMLVVGNGRCDLMDKKATFIYEGIYFWCHSKWKKPLL